MVWLGVLLILGLVAVALLKTASRGEAPEPADALPYRAVSSLLSPAEREFFGVLERAIPASAVVFAKVRMADLFAIRASGKERHAAFSRISQKHADFVLVDRATMAPLLAVELDDASHQRERRRARDEVVERIFERAGLPLLRVPVRAGWDATALGREIEAALGGAGEGAVVSLRTSLPRT